MILLIDNHDSFTYNIAQYLKQLGQELTIWKNDEVTIDDVVKLAPNAIVIGPGPCTPDTAGITLPLIDNFAGKTPILGVCLGHQAIVQAFDGHVIKAKHVMHGRISKIHHINKGVFTDIHNPFNATRYHSLVVDSKRLPNCFEVTAWTVDERCDSEKEGKKREGQKRVAEIMGVRHKEMAIEGVQFHPESILSEAGFMLFNNFLINHSLKTLSNDELPQIY